MNKKPFALLRILAAAIVLGSVAASATADSTPEPKKIVSPRFTQELEQPELVKVKVEINRHGFVTSASITESTNDSLNACTLKAINEWTFKPATQDGRAVASSIVQPFSYSNGSIDLVRNRKVSDKAPRVIKRNTPELPNEIAGINGYVNLRVKLDESGSVAGVSVADASHEELVSYAKESITKWKFKPAIKNGEAHASTVLAPFNFSGRDVKRATIESPAVVKHDSQPKAVRRYEPTLPISLEEKRGSAKVLLYVDEFGYVSNTDILESTDDQLADLASDAALRWKFKPAIKDGEAVASQVSLPFVFNGGLLLSQKPVDKNPRVKTSKTPKLSDSISEIDGYVRVMLELDAQGNVVSAAAKQSTHDALIQPSVEAAKTWKFKPAIRDGEAVESRVMVPFVYGES